MVGGLRGQDRFTSPADGAPGSGAGIGSRPRRMEPQAPGPGSVRPPADRAPGSGAELGQAPGRRGPRLWGRARSGPRGMGPQAPGPCSVRPPADGAPGSGAGISSGPRQTRPQAPGPGLVRPRRMRPQVPGLGSVRPRWTRPQAPGPGSVRPLVDEAPGSGAELGQAHDGRGPRGAGRMISCPQRIAPVLSQQRRCLHTNSSVFLVLSTKPVSNLLRQSVFVPRKSSCAA